MDGLDQIAPILASVMFGLFAVFVVFGMLFGMGRGLKRSALRLVIFVSLLLVAFFATPFVIKSGVNLNMTINGMTPAQWVDDLSNRLVEFMQDQFGNYVTPFQDYIKDYAIGIVLALFNLVLFIALYLAVKVISWIIYAIVAHFAAPKRNRDGKKNPKHVWWGLLVGALQGVILFVLFMLPLNGVIGVVNQAANYQALQAQDSSNEPAPQAYQSSWSSDDDDYYYDQNDIASDDSDADVVTVLKKVDSALSGYNMMMRYTGLQFLSNKAFEYQLTVRMDDKSEINLVHDINAGLELYMDAEAFSKVVEKIQKAVDEKDLSKITKQDFQVLRSFVGKAFDLQILKVADRLLTDLDTIFNTPFGDDETYLDGTNIYADSIYGVLIKQNTTEREIPYTAAEGETVPTNYAQYAKGLRAMVNYVAEQKLNLVKNDILSIFDVIETVSTYKITYEGLAEPKTVTDILSQDNVETRDYCNVITAKLAVDQDKYKAGTPLLDVLGDRMGKFSIVQMMGLTDVDNLITYGKMFENESEASLQNFLYDFVPLFFGDSAFTKTNDQNETVDGNWKKLGNVVMEVAGAFRDYCTIDKDIAAIKDRLMSEDANLSPDSAQIQAVLEYLGNLVMTQDYYDAHKDDFGGKTYDQVKFQKVDNLVDAVYDAVNTFEPVKNFLIDRLREMQDDNSYTETLVTMLQSDKANWYSTLHGIVKAANMLNNDSALGNLLNVVKGGKELTAEEMTAKFLDTVTKLDGNDVGEIVYTMMTIPDVGATVQKTLTDVLDQIPTDDTEIYTQIFGATDAPAVQEKVLALQSYLENFDSANATAEKEDELKTIIGDLWDMVEENQNIKDYIAQMQQGSAE